MTKNSPTYPFKNSPEKFVEYKLGMSGSFYNYLFKAYLKADQVNRAKLKITFPELVHADLYQTQKNYYLHLINWAIDNGYPESRVKKYLG